MGKDVFIEIAAGGIGGRSEFLHEPQPADIVKKVCQLESGECTPVLTEKKIDTCEELQAELARLRKAYVPFLENHAPTQESYRKKLPLKEFVLNGAETVTLPYYGGPVGYAKQTYCCDFSLESLPSDRAIYLCFGGADYETIAMVNGDFAGQHEGFFSPFEFEITELVKEGQNTLKIVLKNDWIYGGYENEEDVRIEGDKLYAATGIGWDDPQLGWHHCPPGMGIYGDVFVEFRSKTHIHDVFVRPIPEEERAEAWIEVENTEYSYKDLRFLLSVYGQNFQETVFEKQEFSPETIYLAGMGDSLTQAEVKDIMGKGLSMPAQKGTNLYKFSFPLKDAKIWELDQPFLYQLQVEVIYEGEVTDAASVQFGMREFCQDLDSSPKGMFYLNGRKIRLRGANTMGFEQLDVLRGNFEQLIDDILLAKICNMNFLRITQRPVQDEVYQYCDRLGLMVQTDLPLFGCMRRNKVAEGIRQAEEMERLIRNHAACVIVSYINEPFPNAKNEPHRHLERPELERFFESCDSIVHLQNPDRVIKHVDGDYDPPTEGMPDNHCYPTWYNGHGIDIGKLHRGYWMQVKPNWYYGCGEFGTEGLECSEVMNKYYPREWLREPFDPSNIVNAQTKDLHYFFYDTQEDMESWIEHSQAYQAFATKLMAEAFRRDSRMISNAIHLFIDAWPSGWMKTIMDCDRNPKQAYFAYRNALEPIKVSLRTDRFTYTAGEKFDIETFICNDTNTEGTNYTVRYELYQKEQMIAWGEAQAELANCDVTYVANANFAVLSVNDREQFTLKAILLDKRKEAISYDTVMIEVFENIAVEEDPDVELICDLPVGVHNIAGEQVIVKDCSMLPLHFVSRKTGHDIVREFREKDFSYWYDQAEDMITPILYSTFTADGFTPVLTSSNKNDVGEWCRRNAAAIKAYHGKYYVICQVDLRQENPIAKRFLKNIYDYVRKEKKANDNC